MIVHDSGNRHMPLMLQLDMNMISDDEADLAHLIRLWSGELGMSAGLTTPSELIALHIDRFTQDAHGQLRKLHTTVHFCWSVMVPLLQEGTEVTWIQYQIVAAFAHIGGPASGHYQALLKTYPDTSDLAAPSMWLFCDDGAVPSRCLTIPRQFEEGVTCIWLCRSDQVDLHRLPPAESQASQAALAMLHAMPSIHA